MKLDVAEVKRCLDVPGVSANALVAKDFYLRPPLMVLINETPSGDMEVRCAIAKLLVDAGAKPDQFSNTDRCPLHFFVHEPLLRVVLTAKPPINLSVRRVDGETPLHVHAANREKATVKLLIDAKADLDAQTDQGTTPLMEAISRCSTDVVSLLLEAGADVGIRDKHGCTAINAGVPMGQEAGYADCIDLVRTHVNKLLQLLGQIKPLRFSSPLLKMVVEYIADKHAWDPETTLRLRKLRHWAHVSKDVWVLHGLRPAPPMLDEFPVVPPHFAMGRNLSQMQLFSQPQPLPQPPAQTSAPTEDMTLYGGLPFAHSDDENENENEQ